MTPLNQSSPGLVYARALAILAALLMAAALVFGFVSGDFDREVRALAGMPWGIVAMIDVYIGLLFFSAWMIFREQSRLKGALWFIAFLGLGNLATAVYLIKALNEAGGGLPCSFTGRAARADMPARLLCLLLLLWPAAIIAETRVIERTGYARDAATGALIYTEAHYESYQSGRIISDTVSYRNAAGEEIARKQVDYGPAAAMPDFSLVNFQTGHRESARRADGKLLVRFTEREGVAEETELIRPAGKRDH